VTEFTRKTKKKQLKITNDTIYICTRTHNYCYEKVSFMLNVSSLYAKKRVLNVQKILTSEFQKQTLILLVQKKKKQSV